MQSRFKIETEELTPAWEVAKLRAARHVGRLGEYFIPPEQLREYRRIMEHFRSYREHARGDRLSDDEIEMWSSRTNTEEHIADRRELFKTTRFNQTPHGIVADLIDMTLEHDPSVLTVAEIGVYWGYVLAQFAAKYSQGSFIGVDLARDIPDFNAEFARENLEFVAGYGLDMLERDELIADAVVFSGTATRFRPRELLRFFRAIARNGRYIILSEPLVHLPGNLVLDPGSLSLAGSRPTTLSFEGWPPQYVHNYRAMAESVGFETLHYRVYEPPFWRGIHRIDLIARLRKT